MFKKNIFLFAAISLCFVLSACAMQGNVADLDDEQMDAVSEYAAVMLLKYDANKRSRLVDDEKIKAYEDRLELLESLKLPPQITQEPEESQENENQGTSVPGVAESIQADDTLNDFYVFPQGIDIIYAGHAVQNVYPDGEDTEEFFTIEATEGKKLLVLKFLLCNNSTDDVDMDIFGYNASYKITVNRQLTRGILTTMLLNDMSTYRGTLSAGSQKELCLLTEMDEEMLSSIDDIVITIKNTSKAVTVRLE